MSQWVSANLTWNGIEELTGPFDSEEEANAYGEAHGYGIMSGYEVKKP